MIVLESNQNHAIAEETEVSPTLPASMGMGGGYIPMIVCYGVDHVVCGGGNCTAQGRCYYEEKCPTLKAGGVHGVAIIKSDKMIIGVDLYNQTLTGTAAKTLNAIQSDADHTPVVIIKNGENNRDDNNKHLSNCNRRR